MTNTISIRKKVAELCGFTGDYQEFVLDGLCGINDRSTVRNPLDGSKQYIPVPKYDTSLDAITRAFDDHGLTYILQKGVADNGDIGYFASNPKGEKYSDTAAKAMCYLFIHCMENNDGYKSD
jgi:hypothetical protein